MVTRYQKRISGPLMDRIDIHMQVPRVEFQKLCDLLPGESSAEVRARVEAARRHQRNRFEGTDIASNADMRPATITFTELFTIERRASPNEKVPFSLNGHFQTLR